MKTPRYRAGDRVELVKDGPRMKAGWLGTVEWTGAWGRLVNVTLDHGGDTFFARRELRLVDAAAEPATPCMARAGGRPPSCRALVRPGQGVRQDGLVFCSPACALVDQEDQLA